MKRKSNWIIGLTTSLTLGLAAAGVLAHPSHGGGHGARGGEHRMHGGMGHGMHGQHGMGHGMHGQQGMRGQQGEHARHGAGRGGERGPVMRSLFTDDERTALREKMRAAKTPQERREIAQANHAEAQKRAQAKGITLPEQRGARGGFGPGGGRGTGAAAPASVFPQ